MRKILIGLLALFLTGGFLTGCGREKVTLRVVSGSENQELEPILQACEKATGVQLEMTYQGSVDTMRALQQGAEDYDAVWPASSLWISLGDKDHRVKYAQSVYSTPVVFGIRYSLAEELGFTQGQVSVSDLLEAIRQGKLSFCMTSATQSNSGAMAYLGFINALLGKDTAVTSQDLENQELQSQLTELLSGIDRSSGSSDWLKEMFVKSDYDAMVNYECLIISANQELESQGQEPLYVVYPYDGLTMADSPLGYLDHGDEEKEEAFLKVQEYLMSQEVQDQIQSFGRRTGYGSINPENEQVFCRDWGIDTQKVLSSVALPSREVIQQALDLYQTQLRKPSLTVYCLDYSASMDGEGQRQLEQAMAQILIPQNARDNLLQPSEREKDIAILFDSGILAVYRVDQPTDANMEELYEQICQTSLGGSTDIYRAAMEGLDLLKEFDLESYTPAIILLSDGMSNGDTDFQDFARAYDQAQMDVPVFSILFGDAQEEQLQELADYTNGRVFDGTKDLIQAFRSVKGYN